MKGNDVEKLAMFFPCLFVGALLTAVVGESKREKD